MQAVFAVLLPFAVCAQSTADNGKIDRADPNFVKASLLVMGPGGSLYSCVGHVCFRLECPKFNLDYCFSYESEGVGDKVLSFLSGNLKMGLFAVPTEKYLADYKAEGRGATQYALDLPPEAKQRLWKLLDDKVAEGVNLPYDFIHRGCAQSTLKYLFEATRPAPIEYPPWPAKYEKTMRELFVDAMGSHPWNLSFLQVLGGIDVDADFPKIRRVVVPSDLLEFLQGTKVGGRPILTGESTVLLPQTNGSHRPWFTPMMAAGCMFALAVTSWFAAGVTIDCLFLALQTALGGFLMYLVFGSNLPATTWNWLLVPFNPLPIALWKWRKYCALPFAAITLLWIGFVVFWPHMLTGWPYVALAAAYAVWHVGVWHRGRSANCLCVKGEQV